jgi:hypothetical protein
MLLENALGVNSEFVVHARSAGEPQCAIGGVSPIPGQSDFRGKH